VGVIRIGLLVVAVVIALHLSLSFWQERAPVDESSTVTTAEQSVPAVGIDGAAVPIPPSTGLSTVGRLDQTTSLSQRQFECDGSEFSIDDSEGVEESLQKLEAFREKQRRVADRLANSQDAEHLVFSAVYGAGYNSGSEIAFDRLGKARQVAPNNPLVHWNVLAGCLERAELPFCSQQATEQSAVNADKSNGALWAMIAIRRARAGNDNGALQALRQANTAPELNLYLIEQTMLFERGLAAASTELDYSERITDAFGHALATTSVFLDLYNICKDRLTINVQWQHQCLQQGQRLVNADYSRLASMAGLDLQELVYQASGDRRALAAVTDMRAELMDRIQNDVNSNTGIIAGYDDRVAADFLNEWRVKGEFAAFDYLIAETARLEADPNYDPCIL